MLIYVYRMTMQVLSMTFKHFMYLDHFIKQGIHSKSIKFYGKCSVPVVVRAYIIYIYSGISLELRSLKGFIIAINPFYKHLYLFQICETVILHFVMVYSLYMFNHVYTCLYPTKLQNKSKYIKI